MTTSANVPGRFIPHSDALAEAGPGTTSIPELLSRHPEHLTREDRRKLVAEFQLQAQNWMAAEATGATRQAAKQNQAGVKSTTTQASEIF